MESERGNLMDERRSLARLRAAQRGDRSAFQAICSELRRPLLHRLRAELEARGGAPDESVLAPLLDKLCDRAFTELPEKPSDWCTYDWLVWLGKREVSVGTRSD